MNVREAVAQTLETQQALSVIAAMLVLTAYRFPRQADVYNLEEFDYLIVGAGSAGAIIADRLSECKGNSVLVMEAGDDPTIASLLSGLYSYLPKTPSDWNITSEQSDTNTCRSTKASYPTGHVLGGTSSIDWLMYLRGVPEDYDSWAIKVNDSTWSWKNVFPYFIKSESLKSKAILKSSDALYHGKDGFLGITRENRPEAFQIFHSFGEVHKPVLDINGREKFGFTPALYTISKGFRQTTALNNLGAHKNRNNLNVLKRCLVTEILFDKNNNAIGVKAILTDTEKEIIFRARKEVIVSAGALNSPKLLMLSGIGPKNHLQSLGIKVRSDLPVGFNFKTQVTASILMKINKSNDTIPPSDPHDAPNPAVIGQICLNNKQRTDYISTSFAIPHDSSTPIKLCSQTFELDDDICEIMDQATKGTNTLFTGVRISHPKSQGRIFLRSTNPHDIPRLCDGVLTEESDIDDLAYYVEDFVKVLNTTYLRSMNAELVDLKLRDCSSLKFVSRNYWKCYVRKIAKRIYNYSGTCGMGRVVDTKLQVFNVKKLRVADASIFPDIISVSLRAPTYMVAEKVSDMIKRKYGCRTC